MKMQTLTLILTALFSASLFADGGVDGGGGGTLPADPIGVFEVKRTIKTSKRDLQLVFNRLSWSADVRQSKDPLSQKLFSGKRNIRTVLNETDLEIRDSAPCYASDGREVDASIYASRPNTICLSAYRVAPKLIDERARTEILALIAHELSHLLGASEAEAREFQQDVAYQLKEMTASQVRAYLENYWAKLELFGRQLRSQIINMQNWPEEEFVDQSGLLREFQRDVQSAVFQYGATVLTFDSREYEYFDYQMERLNAARLYMDSVSVSFPSGKIAKTLYEKIFESKNHVTMEHYRKVANKYPTESRFNNLPIKRIESREDLKSELQSLLFYFGQEEEVARAYLYHFQVPEYNRPWTLNPNPWLQFLGEFEVVSSTCKNQGSYARTGFKIYFEEGRLTLKELYANGWGNQPLESGEHGSNGLIRIDGGQNKAIKFEEQGSYWDDFFQQKKEITFTSSGARLSVSSFRKTGMHHSSKGAEYESSTCAFTLKKM